MKVTVGGDGPATLVVIHGGPGVPTRYMSSLWDLADARRVVMWDQLGCGDSDHPGDPSLWTMERFVSETAAVVHGVADGPVDVLGHSWGGMLAQQYALEFPETVRTLVLASTASSTEAIRRDAWRLAEQLPAPLADAIRAGETTGGRRSPEYRLALREFHRRHLCRVPFPPDVANAFRDTSHDVLDALMGPSDFSISNGLRDWDVTDAISRLDLPTLVTCGRHDQASPESSSAMADALRDARLRVFERAAHLAHWEQRMEFMRTVEEFLRQ